MAILKNRLLLPVILILTSCALPLAAHAATCPWLNAATAKGVLGGDVHVSITETVVPGATQKDTACTFARDNGAGTLTISVHTMQDVQQYRTYTVDCGIGAERLIGAGNEAISCWLHSANGDAIAEAVGRVRSRAFVIRWQQPSIPGNDYRSGHGQAILQNLSEQVAGSMF